MVQPGTFDQIRALENPALALEGEQASAEPLQPSKAGCDPCATGAFEKPKIRR